MYCLNGLVTCGFIRIYYNLKDFIRAVDFISSYFIDVIKAGKHSERKYVEAVQLKSNCIRSSTVVIVK